MARISWHPAFVQALAIELEDYRDVLVFESEHQLTTEPLKIDVLIIKKKKDVLIKKNIAHIFRSFNIVEYKSPTDRISIEDYHKTQCYARLYAALNKVDMNEMSVTVVSTRYPRKLLSFLKKRYAVRQIQQGIYFVERDTCPTQVIVSEALSVEDNLWLGSLRNDLSAEDLDRIAMAKEPALPMDAYVHVIGESNVETLEELEMRKKKGIILSEKLDAFFTEKYGAPWIAKGRMEGEVRGEVRGGRNTVLTVLRARFKKVPKDVEKAILGMSEPVALESWAAHAATCSTMDEFAKALKE